jgi:hypothetical protein
MLGPPFTRTNVVCRRHIKTEPAQAGNAVSKTRTIIESQSSEMGQKATISTRLANDRYLIGKRTCGLIQHYAKGVLHRLSLASSGLRRVTNL